MRQPNTWFRRLAPVIVLSVLIPVLSGCGTVADVQAKTKTAKINKILFDFPFTALPSWTSLVKYATERAGEKGVKLEVTNDNMDLSQQVTNLNTNLSRDVDAVVSFPYDPASIEGVAQQYMSSGKYWVSYANPLKGQDALLGLNPTESGLMLGKNAGKWINEKLGGRGKVMIVGDKAITFTAERTQGIIDGLKEVAPAATIVATQPGTSPDQGLSVTQTVLSQHPDLNVVLTTSGDAAQGAYQALVQSGRSESDPSTYVGGLDGNAFGFKQMKAGHFMRALATISAKDVGYAVVDIPLSLAAGTFKDFNVPVTMVTPDTTNLDDYITEYGG